MTFSKKFLYGITIAYSIGAVLLILVMTDLFEESPFQKRYIVLWMLIVVNTFMLVKRWKAHRKNLR
jgi:undecaprenyl pyrophosphate phosphatase UppP